MKVAAFIFGGAWGVWVVASYGLTPVSFAGCCAGAVVIGAATAWALTR